MYRVQCSRSGSPVTSIIEVSKWLHARQIRPVIERHRIADDSVVFNLCFSRADQARAFAKAFAGRIELAS